MTISVRKITDVDILREACEATMRDSRKSQATLRGMYHCEHSPLRTQLFWIRMDSIPTFVSVHCVRHKIGVEHFVGTNRADRGGDPGAGRYTPINHSVLVNAESLINMSRKRLCFQASEETRRVMLQIKEAIRHVDPDLADYMVPNCVYRGGLCVEPRPCGQYTVRKYRPRESETMMMKGEV